MNSLFFRAVLAVGLLIGFYLLAVAIAGGLMFIPVAEWTYSNRIHPKLALVCIIGGLSIIWAILPRFDSFEAPGPRLLPEHHPKLFAELRSIADAAQQPVPAEVYLIHDVNAWVTNRGGIMGFGSRPVMGIGLPLLQSLTIDEFRAVLAHEFGHYHGSDTALGPWIYKTRSAIGRALGSLGDSILSYPFLAYGKIFLRITHAISRQQEFVADALAAKIAGSQHVVTGLRKVHGAGPLCSAYWENEVIPVLSAGYRPPLAAGFGDFILAKKVNEAMSKLIAEHENSGEYNPYDTHPPLHERIAAVKNIPEGPARRNEAAITLIGNVVELERDLLFIGFGGSNVDKLKSLDWRDAGEQVYLPLYNKLLTNNSKALAGKAVAQLPELCTDMKFLDSLRTTTNQKPGSDVRGFRIAVLGGAFVIALHKAGWKVNAQLGEQLKLEKNGQTIDPFEEVTAVADKKRPAHAWLEQTTAWGCANYMLN